ncbi:MAG TPA: hypothetical protein VNM72_03070 [Blastocatellia bacterium]|nr:hypothetical protein [Blastocatellia bacterium]
MAVRVNLATEPFHNRRPWVLAVALVALTSGLFSYAWGERSRVLTQQAEALSSEIANQERRLQSLRRQLPRSVPSDQLTPLEQEGIRTASFLIERRLFGWSRLLEVIERHLGPNVRLTTISVAPAEDVPVDPLNPGAGPVKVSLTIVGKELSDILQALERLQRTGEFSRFLPRKQSTLEATNETEYELEALYQARRR